MLKLVTLGRLELTRDAVPVLPGRRKLLAVLVYLAAQRGRLVSRARLADLFWPVEDAVRARRSVRQALTDLRRAVGPALREADDSVALSADSIQLDATELETAVTAGDYAAAVELWAGDFLAGAEDVGGDDFRAWLDSEREAIRSHFGMALEQLTDQAERRGAWETGLQLTRAWIATFPYDEHANARHIRLLALAGRRAEAAAAQEAFRQRLQAELGDEPSAEFRALTQRALESSAGERSASPAGKGLLSPDLVARETEFATLSALWQDVAAGGTGVVLLEGEDGSGKSRLAEEFLRWAGQREPKPVVLHARAFEAEQTRAWVLLRHLLAGLAAAPGLGGCPAPVLKLLATLVPEIAERFPSLSPGESEGTTADAVARGLADVAAERPVLLVVDDTHYADPESREVIEALCRHPSSGVLAILTAIPNGLPSLASLERGQAGGGLQRIALEPLTEAELERLLAGMADFSPADRRALAARLHVACGGNPLAAVELVTTLADRGVIAPGLDGLWALQAALDEAPFPVPVSIRNAAGARLRELPADATRVLEAVAVLGRDTEIGLLGEVSRLDSAKVDDAVDQLVSGRFLRPAGDGMPRPEFIHDLVRQATYQRMGSARRQAMHRRAWRALRRQGIPDAARQAAVAHHHACMGRGRRGLWLAAAGVLLSLGIATAALLGTRARIAVSPTTVAILPFNVRGGAGYAYLGEGMVTMLGAALDGLGGLSTADSRGLLSFVAGKPQSPERGQQAARHFGAGLFVLGDLVEANGRIDLAASLYDARARLQTTGRASAATEAGIYGAVDELAKQLVVQRRTAPGEEVARVAAATTSSLPALKAYLAGELLLRQGDFSAAVDSFRVAVAADTAFALAYYRLAIAAEWDQRMVLPEQAARQAARYGDRLTERTRLLVDALLAWRSGQLSAARGKYLGILSRYPKDVEAWFQLGEVLFHAGPVLGESVAGAKAAWQQVLALEPNNLFATLHLARIAAAEDDSAGLAAVVPRVPELQVDGDRRLLELAAWRALVFRNESEATRVLRYMQRPVPTGSVIWQLAIYSRNLAGSERFARHLRTQMPGLAEELLLQLELVRGQWRASAARLARVGGVDVVPLLSRAYVAGLPFVAIPRDQLLRLRDELRAWKPPPPAQNYDDPGLSSYHSFVYPQIQRYLLGALSVRAGELDAATRYAGELEQLAHPAHARSLLRDLTLGLRAMVARAEGHPEAALKLLESIQPAATRPELGSPILSRALERYLRAELLQQLGRGEEALGWFEAMAQLSPPELVFLAPSLLHRAEIYEGLGRSAEAAAHYTRFLELWKDADPESQGVVGQARARLAALAR